MFLTWSGLGKWSNLCFFFQLTSWEVLVLHPFFFDDISMIYVCTCCANRFRPSHFHPDWPIVDPIPRSLYINRRNRSSPIFPIFSHMKVPSILGWLSHMQTFFEPRGPSYGPKRLSSIVFPSVRWKDDPSPPLRSQVETRGLKKKNCSQTLPEGPINHMTSSRFHTSSIHPLKSWSNPNPCTKTWVQPYGLKEGVNFKRGT